MSDGDLTSGTDPLRDAAVAYFKDVYQVTDIKIQAPIDNNLLWTPSIHFLVHDHLMIAVEASESAYPMILSLRRVDLEKLQFPVAVYSVCPEETYLADQKEAKRLINDGYGLLTVAGDGSVQKRASSIPILQVIHKEEFRDRVESLPQTTKQRLARSFDAYLQNAPLGVNDITEAVEGMVLKAGRVAARKGWIAASQAKHGKTAQTLVAMQACPQLQSCAAAIGGVQGYVSTWRNTSHHFPKSPAKAAMKYRECRHAFIEGIQQIKAFREAFGKLGLRVNL